MFFRIKRRPLPALVTTLALVLASLALRHSLGLPWNTGWDRRTSIQILLQILLGLAVVLSGGGCLAFLFQRRYPQRWQVFLDFVRQESPVAVFAGGLMAGCGEEVFFRWTVIDAVGSSLGWGLAVGVAVSGMVSAAAHLVPERNLRPLAMWPGWEGLALGAIYIATDRLLVVALVHAVVDVIVGGLVYLRGRPGTVPRMEGR